MKPPNTADERERRFVQYVLTLNKGEISELRLGRMNRIANFRKALMQLLNEFIENRAEELALSMLWEHAPERPKPAELTVPKQRIDRKRVIPPWVREESKALREQGR
jgi:hypothetical protein